MLVCKRETLQHVERVHLDLALQIHLHLIKHFHARFFFLGMAACRKLIII